MDISVRIKELRKKTGLSQSKLSAKFGIPVRTLQQWEQGISSPSEKLFEKLEIVKVRIVRNMAVISWKALRRISPKKV